MQFKLIPEPTFTAKVDIPIPGKDKPANIKCEFLHMTEDAYKAFQDEMKAGSHKDEDVLMRFLRGWEGPDEEFSKDAVALLCQNYAGAPFAISEAYTKELRKGRLGN